MDSLEVTKNFVDFMFAPINSLLSTMSAFDSVQSPIQEEVETPPLRTFKFTEVMETTIQVPDCEEVESAAWTKFNVCSVKPTRVKMNMHEVV